MERKQKDEEDEGGLDKGGGRGQRGGFIREGFSFVLARLSKFP